MSDETKTTTEAVDTHPEDNGAGKTFTQEEVNKIVSERLTREREKGKPEPADERERELTARENALGCKEYITEKGLPAVLLELFDTGDKGKFTAAVGKLVEAFPDIVPGAVKPPRVVAPTNGLPHSDRIAEAFRPKI